MIVRAADEEDGPALKYASNRLRADKSIVLKAVKEYGCALEYASVTLQDNETIVAQLSRMMDRL